ncbi:hypothetical protein GW17_00055835, partial [Ensete ventricosum]
EEERPTAEEAEKERPVFDDDDDDDVSESVGSEDDDIDGNGHATPPSSQLQARTEPSVVVAAESGGLHPSASSDQATNLNPNPNTTLFDSTAAALPLPQNGAIPVPVLPIAAILAPSDDAAFFNPTSSSVAVPGAATSASEERRSVAVVSFDESRRLFQRLWTDEEEIKILQGFFEFTSKRGTTFASHQYDTGPFYEEIKKQFQIEFTKNQLIEKLRRLKKKYRNCVSRMGSVGKDFAFKSSHERAIYEIACKIWSAGSKRAHESDDEDLNASNNAISDEIIADDEMHTPLASSAGIPNIIEETVKNCLSPLFKEVVNSAIGSPLGPGLIGGTSPLNLLPMSLRGGDSLVAPGMTMDDKWRTQQILELEVYLKRIELVMDHIKATMEELKSAVS